MKINANGIATWGGSIVAWDDIVSISAYKADAITKVLTYLIFDHDSGEYLELTDEDADFLTIIDTLAEYLDLPEDYKNRIEAITPDDGILELWKKSSGISR